MKFLLTIPAIALLNFLFIHKGLANTYYICDCAVSSEVSCIPGDDSNSGLTIDTPWQSTAKLNTIINSLQAGDRILFAKGGAWNNAALQNIFNLNSSSTNPIIFDSYNPSWGGSAKPILIESRPNTNLFNFEDGGNADHDEGYIVRNLDLQGGGTGQWAVFAYNDADYIHLESIDISGFEIGVHCAGSNTPNTGADTQNQNMTLLNSTIRNCSSQGFLGGGDSLLIQGCLFENNGFAQAVFNHNIYLSNGDYVIIKNNELYQSAVINGKADGVSLVVHGVLDHLLIEGNYIHEDSEMVTGNAWGIAVDPGYSSAEAFTNLVIRGNLVVNMFNIGIGVASAPSAIIENNVIINDASSNLVAIAAPDRIRGDNDQETTNVTVRNNSIYLRNANDFTIGIRVGDEGEDYTIVSNLISLDGGNGLALNLEDQSYNSVDYNMIELINGANWGDGIDKITWSTTRGFDLESLEGDPQFSSTNSTDYDLKPLATSPVIDSGHPDLSSLSDYDGLPRNGISDIGAYEISTISTSHELPKVNKHKIRCFPNPTRDIITLHTDASLIGTSYDLYNFQGKVVLTGKINSERININLDHLSTGIYHIMIKQNSTDFIRIIKL